MKLEYALTLAVVLIVAALFVSIVVPQAQAEIAQAMAPLQNLSDTIPTVTP